MKRLNELKQMRQEKKRDISSITLEQWAKYFGELLNKSSAEF